MSAAAAASWFTAERAAGTALSCVVTAGAMASPAEDVFSKSVCDVLTTASFDVPPRVGNVNQLSADVARARTDATSADATFIFPAAACGEVLESMDGLDEVTCALTVALVSGCVGACRPAMDAAADGEWPASKLGADVVGRASIVVCSDMADVTPS